MSSNAQLQRVLSLVSDKSLKDIKEQLQLSFVLEGEFDPNQEAAKEDSIQLYVTSILEDEQRTTNEKFSQIVRQLRKMYDSIDGFDVKAQMIYEPRDGPFEEETTMLFYMLVAMLSSSGLGC